MVSIGYKYELVNTISITRHRNSMVSIGYKYELVNTISITRHRNSLVSIGYKYELVNTTDFPKTVGPDRQKCSRTDNFKIYIGPNVR